MTEHVPRRRPSLTDVAAHAGVSKGAVSKVIRDAYGVSPAMRARVESAIKELGYRPRLAARAMRGSSYSIGLELPNLGNEFFSEVFNGAGAGLVGSGYQLLMAPGLDQTGAIPVLENLADRQVDGVIAVSPEVSPEWLEEFASTIPVVLVGRHDRSRNYDTVTSDDDTGTRLALGHLMDLGHRGIAHLTLAMTHERDDALPAHTIRRRTYERMMAEAGLEPLVTYCGLDDEDIYRTAKELLTHNKAVTAIFAGNDALAVAALRAFDELGLSSSDVSIAGYDDIPLASHPRISLTTVDQFGDRVGRTAAELLLERIRDGRATPRNIELTPTLRVRGSTQPLDASQR
ncbi:LacI family DNA-binding transcriptional regulator [Leifsonia xyli]|uniref:LacI family DNA-binding transcriptional regulator n=1 Tax=Leifsonia xyli TaxID=1575 RepID=UPI003D66D41D